MTKRGMKGDPFVLRHHLKKRCRRLEKVTSLGTDREKGVNGWRGYKSRHANRRAGRANGQQLKWRRTEVRGSHLLWISYWLPADSKSNHLNKLCCLTSLTYCTFSRDISYLQNPKIFGHHLQALLSLEFLQIGTLPASSVYSMFSL